MADDTGELDWDSASLLHSLVTSRELSLLRTAPETCLELGVTPVAHTPLAGGLATAYYAHALARRAVGRAARSVQWPLVTGAGMGTSVDAKQRTYRGMAAISSSVAAPHRGSGSVVAWMSQWAIDSVMGLCKATLNRLISEAAYAREMRRLRKGLAEAAEAPLRAMRRRCRTSSSSA